MTRAQFIKQHKREPRNCKAAGVRKTLFPLSKFERERMKA